MINGLFETCAALAIFLHIIKLIHDKKHAGVSIIATIFFTTWGAWNLFFYPHVGLWWSFIGGTFVFGANTAYVILLIVLSFNTRSKK